MNIHTLLDSTDVKILNCLQKDARMSITDISQTVEMSYGSVDNRIQKLKAKGIIQGFRIVLDLNKLGGGISFFLFLERKNHSLNSLESIKEAIRSFPEVLFCHVLGGNQDFLIQIQLPDISLYKQVYERLSGIFQEIGSLSSHFVLDELKQDGRIDLSHLTKGSSN